MKCKQRVAVAIQAIRLRTAGRTRGRCAAILVAAMTCSQVAAVQSIEYEVTEKSIQVLQADMAAGHISARQLVELYLARIAAYDRAGPDLGALLTLNADAYSQAEALDTERRQRGPRSLLHGIPLVVKDNFETIDMPTSAGTLALAGFISKRDATQVARLRAAGAIILAKTNMHELGIGTTTVSSIGGQTRNPYGLDRVPGGSSGGTAVAVTASLAAAGLGTDACGSIAIPAAYASIVGLRPTTGLTSTKGMVPVSHTDDTAGPLARTVLDVAILLDAMVHSSDSSYATAAPSTYLAAASSGSLRGVRIGVLSSLFGEDHEDREVSSIIRGALAKSRAHGAQLIELKIPGLMDMLRNNSLIHADFRKDFAAYFAELPNAPVRSLNEILRSGLYESSLEPRLRRHAEADDDQLERAARLRARAAVREALLTSMRLERVAVIAFPPVRRVSPVIGSEPLGANCQISTSTGFPTLVIPAGFAAEDLPVGLALVARPFAERELLAIGAALEVAIGARRAPTTTPPLGQVPAMRRSSFSLELGAGKVRGSVLVEIEWDPLRQLLSYRVEARPSLAPEILALTLRRAGREGEGPVVAALLRPGEARSRGTLRLSPASADLLIELRTRTRAGVAAKQTLSLN